jgi:hypothetical protein
MSEKLYKAVRPNGRDFRTNTVQWAPEKGKARKGRLVKHPTAVSVGADASRYLSVSADPTDLPGSSWPMRLLVVEPEGEAITPEPGSMPNKRAAVAFRVLEEVDPSERFGPQGPEVANVIHRAQLLTPAETHDLYAAWDAARDAARGAARGAAWDAAWYAARGAARAVAGAVAIRDLVGKHGFTQSHYDTLTGPWRRVVGPVHPDDKPLP